MRVTKNIRYVGPETKAHYRKSTLAALVAIASLALLLRYPQGHEVGVDSYFVHGLSQSISATGSIGWLVTPLSYLGLAPFSYSPAVPISMASLSQLSGIDIEPAILVYSVLLALLCPLSGFVLGRAACRQEGAALLVAALFSSAQGIVGFTDWTLSTRGTLFVFVPLVVAFFIETLRSNPSVHRGRDNLALIMSTLVFVHALWLLLLPMLVAAWLVSRLASTEESVLMRSFRARGRAVVVIATAVATCLCLVGFLEFGPAQTRILSGIPQVTGGFLPSNIVTDVGLQYATVVGVGVVLLPIGLIKMLRIPERRRRDALLGLSVVFLPISLDPTYGVALSIPFLLAVSVIALLPTTKADKSQTVHRRSVMPVAGCLVLVLAVGLPAMITIPRSQTLTCQQAWNLDGQTYNAGLYLRYTQPSNTTFAWDDATEAARLEAISGVPSLEPLESLGDLQYPWLARKVPGGMTLYSNLVDAMVKKHQLYNATEWLSLAGTDYEYYWGKHTFVLLVNSIESPAASQILSFYQAHYAVQRCVGAATTFFDSLRASRYVAYTDDLERMFLLQ